MAGKSERRRRGVGRRRTVVGKREKKGQRQERRRDGVLRERNMRGLEQRRKEGEGKK